MQRTRKYIDSLLSSAKNLKEQTKYLEEEIIRLSGVDEYARIMNQHDHLIAKLDEELFSIPFGHSYTGTFYLKKPYLLPYEFEKFEGVLFMRADLVSWQVIKGEGFKYQMYYRYVYKEPSAFAKAEIKREDAVSVYAKNLKEAFEVAIAK